MAGWRAQGSIIAGAMLLVLAMSGAASAAGAVTSPWGIAASANMAAPAAELAGVSCQSVTSCVAVGNSVGPNGVNRTLVESWDGARWSAQASASPAAPAFLIAVSCFSTQVCAAVGYIATATANGTQKVTALAEVRNGRSWSLTPTPLAAGSVLSGVSCPAANECFAVGRGGPHGMLIERWDGTAWRLQADSLPGGGSASMFGVSCVSLTFCVAVGAGPAEIWNGKSWTVHSGEPPANSWFVSVSCASPTWCMAITARQAESWNGATWTVQPMHASELNGQVQLATVSCTSAAFCEAVGLFNSNANLTTDPIGATWDGTQWKFEAPVNPPPGAQASLSGVACPSSSKCQAVGATIDEFFNSHVLAESRSPGWGLEPAATPAGAAYTWLTAVSCASSSACLAVGYNDFGGYERALAERWNGSRWAMVPVPLPHPPSALQQSVLNGVSCTSATACTAVGQADSFSSPGEGTLTITPLAERWNGTSWVIQPAPHPGQQSGFSGVSCWSPSGCTAVGDRPGATLGSQATLAEVWDGSTWAVQRTANRAGAQATVLNGVSCTAATACAAVGDYATSGAPGNVFPFAEQWNGVTWTAAHVPTTSALNDRLEGVSCTAPAACKAVGWSFDNAGYHPLAAALTGAGWTLQPAAAPATNSQLLAVSCTPAGCVAVGSDNAGVLIEGSSGSAWTQQSAPQPVAGYRPALSGVSCAAGGGCTAAGTYSPYADGLQVSLIEHRS